MKFYQKSNIQRVLFQAVLGFSLLFSHSAFSVSFKIGKCEVSYKEKHEFQINEKTRKSSGETSYFFDLSQSPLVPKNPYDRMFLENAHDEPGIRILFKAKKHNPDHFQVTLKAEGPIGLSLEWKKEMKALEEHYQSQSGHASARLGHNNIGLDLGIELANQFSVEFSLSSVYFKEDLKLLMDQVLIEKYLSLEVRNHILKTLHYYSAQDMKKEVSELVEKYKQDTQTSAPVTLIHGLSDLNEKKASDEVNPFYVAGEIIRESGKKDDTDSHLVLVADLYSHIPENDPAYVPAQSWLSHYYYAKDPKFTLSTAMSPETKKEIDRARMLEVLSTQFRLPKEKRDQSLIDQGCVDYSYSGLGIEGKPFPFHLEPTPECILNLTDLAAKYLKEAQEAQEACKKLKEAQEQFAKIQGICEAMLSPSKGTTATSNP